MARGRRPLDKLTVQRDGLNRDRKDLAESAHERGLEHDPVALATAAVSIVGVHGNCPSRFAGGVPVQHQELAGFSGPSDDLYPVTVGVVLLNEVVQIEDAESLLLLDEN